MPKSAAGFMAELPSRTTTLKILALSRTMPERVEIEFATVAVWWEKIQWSAEQIYRRGF